MMSNLEAPFNDISEIPLPPSIEKIVVFLEGISGRTGGPLVPAGRPVMIGATSFPANFSENLQGNFPGAVGRSALQFAGRYTASPAQIFTSGASIGTDGSITAIMTRYQISAMDLQAVAGYLRHVGIRRYLMPQHHQAVGTELESKTNPPMLAVTPGFVGNSRAIAPASAPYQSSNLSNNVAYVSVASNNNVYNATGATRHAYEEPPVRTIRRSDLTPTESVNQYGFQSNRPGTGLFRQPASSPFTQTVSSPRQSPLVSPTHQPVEVASTVPSVLASRPAAPAQLSWMRWVMGANVGMGMALAGIALQRKYADERAAFEASLHHISHPAPTPIPAPNNFVHSVARPISQSESHHVVTEHISRSVRGTHQTPTRGFVQPAPTHHVPVHEELPRIEPGIIRRHLSGNEDTDSKTEKSSETPSVATPRSSEKASEKTKDTLPLREEKGDSEPTQEPVKKSVSPPTQVAPHSSEPNTGSNSLGFNWLSNLPSLATQSNWVGMPDWLPGLASALGTVMKLMPQGLAALPTTTANQAAMVVASRSVATNLNTGSVSGLTVPNLTTQGGAIPSIATIEPVQTATASLGRATSWARVSAQPQINASVSERVTPQSHAGFSRSGIIPLTQSTAQSLSTIGTPLLSFVTPEGTVGSVVRNPLIPIASNFSKTRQISNASYTSQGSDMQSTSSTSVPYVPNVHSASIPHAIHSTSVPYVPNVHSASIPHAIHSTSVPYVPNVHSASIPHAIHVSNVPANPTEATQPIYVDPLHGQITLVAAPLHVATEQGESSGAALAFSWQSLLPGMAPLEAGSLAQLSQTLPPGVQAVYPALPIGSAGQNAINIPLGTGLLGHLLHHGYGPHAGAMAQTAADQAKRSRGTAAANNPITALIIPTRRPMGQNAGVLQGVPVQPVANPVQSPNTIANPNYFLGNTSPNRASSSARTGGVLNLMGLPVQLAPSMSTQVVHQQRAAMRQGTEQATYSNFIRPALFSTLQQSLVPSAKSVTVEPDTRAWQRVSHDFNLSGGGGTAGNAPMLALNSGPTAAHMAPNPPRALTKVLSEGISSIVSPHRALSSPAFDTAAMHGQGRGVLPNTTNALMGSPLRPVEHSRMPTGHGTLGQGLDTTTSPFLASRPLLPGISTHLPVREPGSLVTSNGLRGGNRRSVEASMPGSFAMPDRVSNSILNPLSNPISNLISRSPLSRSSRDSDYHPIPDARTSFADAHSRRGEYIDALRARSGGVTVKTDQFIRSLTSGQVQNMLPGLQDNRFLATERQSGGPGQLLSGMYSSTSPASSFTLPLRGRGAQDMSAFTRALPAKNSVAAPLLPHVENRLKSQIAGETRTYMPNRTQGATAPNYRHAVSPFSGRPMTTSVSMSRPLALQKSLKGHGVERRMEMGHGAARAQESAVIGAREQGTQAYEVHLVANEVWTILKRRLTVEAERRGRFA